MKRLAKLGVAALLAGVSACLAPGALAQTTGQTPGQDSDVIVGRGNTEPAPVDSIDRVVPQGVGGGERAFASRGADGVRTVRPGALLFASFDTNHDGKITREEFEAGARASFRVADANGDGVISGFEQNDWAAAVGTSNDILSNPMAFDTDLDRNVTEEEFVTGLRRIAEPITDAQTGVIRFSDLVQPLRPTEGAQARGGPPPGGPGGRMTGPFAER